MYICNYVFLYLFKIINLNNIKFNNIEISKDELFIWD